MKWMGSRVARRARWLLALVWLATPSESWGYTPDSPEVRQMLSRAMAFIAKARRDGPHTSKLGGQAVMGLAAYKYDRRFGTGGEELPELTQFAVNQARAAARGQGMGISDNYSLGLALILLTEVEPHRHTAEITALVETVKKLQKPNGAWGYVHSTQGDTSQLQYPVLGAWAARSAGVDFPAESVKDVLNYLLRTQDPGGGWGYQGNDPETFSRVAQTSMRPSLVAAGLGSVYVAADFLGMSKEGPARRVTGTRLPSVLVPVADDESRAARAAPLAGVDTARVKQAMADGNRWFQQYSGLSTPQWQYYFLYGYERYQSFREKVEGTYEEEPDWYNRGVRLLRELQNADGSWGTRSDVGGGFEESEQPVATGFAMLFLLRSTRETIEKTVDRDGVLRGGHELPSDVSDVRLRDHRIVAPAITAEVDDLIAMLEDDEGERIEALLQNPDTISLSQLPDSGREYSERLARVLRSGSYQARILAARALGRQGSLDNVPSLIYALTDGDPRVVREARDGLRLTSRKFDGFGLTDSATPEEVQAAVKQWKAWYQSVRPDAVFLD